MDLDPTALRWFVAVGRELHFGRAAAALGVARQRLSRAMIALEAELGTELFDRAAASTELTAAGRALLEAAPARLLAAEESAAALAAEAARPVPFRVAFVPGVTVTKWTREWEHRHPDIPLEVFLVPVEDQTRVLHDGRADVSFVRLPIDRERLSAIPLYDEVAVAVVGKEHPLSLAESLTLADLVGEHLVQDPDDVPEWRDAATEVREGTRPELPAPATPEDALELVAAGAGIAVLPHSIARLHARKDVVARPVSDLPETHISIAWPAAGTTDRVQEFVGIVRGRTAASSRTAPTPPAERNTAAQAGARAGAKSGQKAGARSTRKPASGARGGRNAGGSRSRGR